jgi:hypothetical protein
VKLVNDILYIEYPELVEAGVIENTIRKAKENTRKSWSFIQDPEDKRKVLIEFEKLRQNYKDLVIAKFGNPYIYISRQPIKKMVQWDAEAERFYLGFRYGENKSLSEAHVNKYTTAASWLNMLHTAMADKKELKKLLNLDIAEFWINVCELIKEGKIDLPSSSRRLMARMKEYKEKGYGCLVDPQFGNKKAAKVADEVAESLLLEMIAQHNQHDDVFIANTYNAWAEGNGYKAITSATVGVWRRNKEHLIISERAGSPALNEKYIKQVKGMRPSFPLAFVESDDNHLDLFFIDVEDTGSSKYYHKYKAIVVVDSYNDYVLGYAYAENLTMDLVKMAYLNAMYHIRSLTGGWYLPHEIKTDNWALASLKPFYESMGNYMKTPVGSKHRGYIEQFFGSALWKRSIKAGANNYSGNNITAKTRGINSDLLDIAKKDFPTVGAEAVKQIEGFFHRLRHTPGAHGRTKQEAWVEAWNNLPADKKRPIDDVQFLLKFGIEHNYRGQGIQISNRGVEPKINGCAYSYDLEEYDLQHIGKSVSILYDPHDMSRVLLTDFDSVRVLAREAKLQPRALADADLGSRTRLNEIFNAKKAAVDMIGEKSDKRKKVLLDHFIDAEAVLQAGVAVPKELKQAAENRVLTQHTNNEDYNLFDQL